MNATIVKLQPTQVWNNFERLNAVPRASKKEQQVIAFMRDFGTKLGLETLVDEVGNVLIRKPATPGREKRKTVILQGHLDMVHQKTTTHNLTSPRKAFNRMSMKDGSKHAGQRSVRTTGSA